MIFGSGYLVDDICNAVDQTKWFQLQILDEIRVGSELGKKAIRIFAAKDLKATTSQLNDLQKAWVLSFSCTRGMNGFTVSGCFFLL